VSVEALACARKLRLHLRLYVCICTDWIGCRWGCGKLAYLLFCWELFMFIRRKIIIIIMS